jgi:polysaccharide biosynthesis transport protein
MIASTIPMNLAQPTTSSPRQLLNLLRVHLTRWLVPAVAVTAVAVAYAILHTPTWEAAQALMVRNDASNPERSPGKFSIPDEMKTVQETLLEVARSRSVLRAALLEVGPPADYRGPAAWPTDRDVIEVRNNIKLAPPKGAEFGKTEIFYLNVRAETRQRSLALNEAIAKQLQGHFQELRDAKAQSMVDELTKSVSLAKTDLDRATAAIQTTENRVGTDLAELRSMQDAISGDSALRRSVEEIRTQLRDNSLTETTHRELLSVLTAAEDDPGRLVAAPNRLLESYPAIRRLKDGLIDAQLRTSALLGTMKADNPKVLAAKEAEEEIGHNLHSELAIARRGVEVELRVLANRRKLIESQLGNANERLGRVANLRAAYANQAADVKSRTVLLERAEQNLAEARAACASAKAASLISRIDSPDAGIYPVGPSRATISIFGVLAGLVAGFGVVFLTVPSPRSPVADDSHAPVVASGDNGSAKLSCPDTHLSINRALYRLVG